MMNVTVLRQTLLVLVVHPNPGSELLADNQHHPWQQNRTCIYSTFKIVEKQKYQVFNTCTYLF